VQNDTFTQNIQRSLSRLLELASRPERSLDPDGLDPEHLAPDHLEPNHSAQTEAPLLQPPGSAHANLTGDHLTSAPMTGPRLTSSSPDTSGPDRSAAQLSVPHSSATEPLLNNRQLNDWQLNERQLGTPPVLDPSEAQAMLLRLANCMRDSFDETGIFPTVIQELIKLLNLTGCQVRLYNGDQTAVSVQYEYQIDLLEPDRAIHRQAFPDVAVRLLPYAAQICPYRPEEHQALTILEQPMLDSLGDLGMIVLQRRQPDWFSEAELNLVDLVASHCAIALRRGRFAQTAQTQSVELKRLNQLQDTFLGTVSYELRLPLSNIKMAIQMITLAFRKDPAALPDQPVVLPPELFEKVVKYLDVLQRECDRETKLVQDLLDLQQLDTDTLSLMMSAISLTEWLPYVVNPLQKRCQESQLELDYSIAPDLPQLMCDQISLSRIVTELLTNAAKFTPAQEKIWMTVAQVSDADRADRRRGEPADRRRATRLGPDRREAAADGSLLQIQVCNSGVEIPAEEAGRVFDKFFRIPKLDLRKAGGTGLGLALVQKLVQRLDGTITLESSAGQTCFTVELPFQGVRH
jgi:signal transduction histidine kinase